MTIAYADPVGLQTATTTAANATVRPGPDPARVDNRLPFLSWAAAYLLGYGAFAVSRGTDPLLALPGLVPVVVLAAGLLGATAVTTVSVVRAQRGVSGPAALSGTLFGIAWAIGFGALFLLVTALAGVLDEPRVETLLWPAGSGLVVGLLYLMGGALDRDVVQYALGGWLALVTTAGVFLGTPGLYGVLALGAPAGYLVAAALDHRRRAASVGIARRRAEEE